MMKKLILIILMFSSAAVMRASDAKWISADDSLRNNTNTWIEFQKDFSLKNKPRKAEVKIAADSKYWLWINDSLAVFEGCLKRGPNPTDGYYDVVELAPYLKKGHNRLRILLCYFGKPGFSHKSSGASGLIFDGSDIALVSDSTWMSRRLPEFGTAGAPITNYRLSESNIRYDARQEGSNPFKPSLELGSWGASPWNGLAERPIPLLKDYGVKYATPVRETDNEGNIVLSLRLPYNMQLTPVIDVTDPSGGSVIRIETDHVRGGSADCVRAEYITRPGSQQYESPGWINGDVLYIIYPSDSSLTVNRVGYRETGYNSDFEGDFTCSDSTVNRFWDKAMRTLYVNMRDNFFDCPDRERAQWWGDVTVLMGQSLYQLSPTANALLRKAIYELVDWQRSDGTLYAPVPSDNWHKELPAQSLASVGPYGFMYYYKHTGDTATLKHVYGPVKRYLDVWTLDDTGLTNERKGDWAWGDWGTNIDMRLLLAAWHYMALKSTAEMAELTGNHADVSVFQNKMDSIAAAFDRCWNGYAYRHPSYHGTTDDRVQALAVVSGLASPSRYENIFKVMQTQENASPYMEKYVLEALMKMGHGDYALERFKKRFNNMIADTLHTTLYEGWEEGGYGGGSVNHAWSGGMLTVIAENVCGVRPLVPGWKEFIISPEPIISQCDIIIPSVMGIIRSAFVDNDDLFTLDVDVPSGTKCTVKLPDFNYTTVTIDGKTYKTDELPVLAKGKHTVIARKTSEI